MADLIALVAKWRQQAADMERNAKAYKRSCIEAKAAQLILGAKILRNCADEVEHEQMASPTVETMVQHDALASPQSPPASS